MTHDDPVRFPVSCPICRKEILAEFRRSDVVGALVNDRPIRLHASCCDKTWTAGYIEMQQIRGHLGVTRLDAASRAPLQEPRDLLED